MPEFCHSCFSCMPRAISSRYCLARSWPAVIVTHPGNPPVITNKSRCAISDASPLKSGAKVDWEFADVGCKKLPVDEIAVDQNRMGRIRVERVQ